MKASLTKLKLEKILNNFIGKEIFRAVVRVEDIGVRNLFFL